MNYPIHMARLKGGAVIMAIFADGNVAFRIDHDAENFPSRLARAYVLPEPVEHVIEGPAKDYLIAYTAGGKAYALDTRTYQRAERWDIGSLEEMLADDADMLARKAAAELETKKTAAERAARELEAETQRVEAAKARLEAEQAGVRSATSTAGNATKAARAARALASRPADDTPDNETETREAAQ